MSLNPYTPRIFCPNCDALLAFGAEGWYECPNCFEPMEITSSDSDSDYADDYVARAEGNKRIVLPKPTALPVARLERMPDIDSSRDAGVATKPYNGVPASQWPKMEDCVSKVMAKGHDKGSAIAICHVSLTKKQLTGEDADADTVALAQKESGFNDFGTDAPSGLQGLVANFVASLKGFTGLGSGEDAPKPDAETAAISGSAWTEDGVTTIFKDKSGHYRWVLFSSSAYEDNDKEVVSRAALERDAERMMTVKEFGPLRFWHVGKPDRAKLSPGPGIDLGTCDFSAVHGNIAIESGLFNDNKVAEALIPHLKEIGSSRGFFHPLFEPDADGTFYNIHTFERSLLPAAKASNRLTQLFVTKEATMRDDQKAALRNLLGPELADKVLSEAETVDTRAAAAGLKNKAAPLPAAAEAGVVGAMALPNTNKEAGHSHIHVHGGVPHDHAHTHTKSHESANWMAPHEHDHEDAEDEPSTEEAAEDAARGVVTKGIHSHEHTHDGSTHSHDHFHPAVHELVNTRGVEHLHEHDLTEKATLKSTEKDSVPASPPPPAKRPTGAASPAAAPAPQPQGVVGDDGVDDEAEDVEALDTADEQVEAETEGDEAEGEGFAEVQAEAFKGMLHDAFMDVVTPFLEGLAAASQAQTLKATTEMGELRAQLKAQADLIKTIQGGIAELVGEVPSSVLKEMRASQSERTVVGNQQGPDQMFNAGYEAFKGAAPAPDAAFNSFMDDFVLAGANGEG